MADLGQDDLVTEAAVATYLHEHPITPGQRLTRVEFLVREPSGSAWLVRWPNGSVRWESEISLSARQVAIPRAGLLESRSA